MRESSTIYLGGARGDVELLELGVLLRLALVREGAVRAVPAAELLHHRLRNRTRPRSAEGASSSVTDNNPDRRRRPDLVGVRAVRARGRGG